MLNYINKAPPKKSYIIINLTTGGRPTVYHWAYLRACTEAQRLAKLQPGHVFVVAYVGDSFSGRAVISVVVDQLN